MGRARGCYCGIPDLRALRIALGLSQDQLGYELGLSGAAIGAHERAVPHKCLHPSSVVLLQALVRSPEIAARLAAVGVSPPVVPLTL